MLSDYPTRIVEGSALDRTMTLVGESGGLSSIYGVSLSETMPGLLCVDTEHGPLYLSPDGEYDVLDMN
jgi:hypothetical protein